MTNFVLTYLLLNATVGNLILESGLDELWSRICLVSPSPQFQAGRRATPLFVASMLCVAGYLVSIL
ncbi:hypothetical protein H6G81_19230 [Scytonema hofmannii FACHB-248]|uniref:Uncharacterized protein n=1 Tax=Scytonema hofmannii FACHB-248 TaxID=1842502 RepID=A0ABR8GU54_9CYAN|nr:MULTISPECIES: hypothetical protein [Nostocales]MBD2606605.1 hypothetical protein [Scytonema hofmannii FACHB-248]